MIITLDWGGHHVQPHNSHTCKGLKTPCQTKYTVGCRLLRGHTATLLAGEVVECACAQAQVHAEFQEGAGRRRAVVYMCTRAPIPRSPYIGATELARHRYIDGHVHANWPLAHA